jgi:hypothetical protein
MRKRITKTEKVDVNAVISNIEHRIETKKQLVRITMRQENCGFREAKDKIYYKSEGKSENTWQRIKREVKLLNN